MKKILIVNNNMYIGGVQKALISLLWKIYDHYDVTLLLFHPAGEYLHQIPPQVKVIQTDSGYRYLGMHRYDAVSLKDRTGRFFYAGISRLLGRKHAVTLMGFGQKRLGEYDVAISYLHNGGDKAFYGGCNDFVLKHVWAKKKVTFLHCDYTKCGADTQENKKQYAQFDRIAACSRGCADAFVRANPEMAEKVQVVPNCHRFEEIRSLAAVAPVPMDPKKINIVTVSRFGGEKSVDRALWAVAGIGNLKERIHYYIVGDGVQKPVILDVMEKEGLHSCVTLCGQLDNPYGYMKAADLLLIPSRSEAAPLVIGEAACLGTPVLSMKTSSAQEMIEETGFGWVCENNVQAMTDALTELLSAPDQIQKVSQELQFRQFTNDAAVTRFRNCVD